MNPIQKQTRKGAGQYDRHGKGVQSHARVRLLLDSIRIEVWVSDGTEIVTQSKDSEWKEDRKERTLESAIHR